MGATLMALTRDELLALSIETDNAIMWAEIRNSPELAELAARRRAMTAEWTRRETANRRYRKDY